MEEGLLIQHTTSFQRRAGWASLEGEVICWDECKKTILIFVLPLQDPSNKTLVMMTLTTFIMINDDDDGDDIDDDIGQVDQG